MRGSDRSGRASHLDHQPTPISHRSVVQHHQKVDVGIRPIRASSNRAEQNDADRIELGDQDIHQHISPRAQRLAGPHRVVVTHGKRQLLHPQDDTGSTTPT